MKVLISAACLAIIAFVGFFFWERYAEAAQERLAAECYELREANRNRTDPSAIIDDGGMYDRCWDYFLQNPPVDGAR